MHPRHAAFALLRRIALQDFAAIPRKTPSWATPAARSLYHNTMRFHSPESPKQKKPQVSQINPKSHAPSPLAPKDQPAYDLTFTCKPCGTRSTHRISKQGYHHGSVLITCPECKNRHIISDHLKIFIDKATTIEDLMRDKGQLVKKGSLSEDGDLEFWDDGTTTRRDKRKSDETSST